MAGKLTGKRFRDMTPEERRAHLLETRGAAWVEHADKVTLHGETIVGTVQNTYWATCTEHGTISAKSKSIAYRTENVRRHLVGLS